MILVVACVHVKVVVRVCPLGHVISGDLRIISSRKLRMLIAKGPNKTGTYAINFV